MVHNSIRLILMFLSSAFAPAQPFVVCVDPLNHVSLFIFYFLFFIIHLRSLTSFLICLMNIPLVRAHSTLVDWYGGLFQNWCNGKRWDFGGDFKVDIVEGCLPPWGSGPGTEPRKEKDVMLTDQCGRHLVYFNIDRNTRHYNVSFPSTPTV